MGGEGGAIPSAMASWLEGPALLDCLAHPRLRISGPRAAGRTCSVLVGLAPAPLLRRAPWRPSAERVVCVWAVPCAHRLLLQLLCHCMVAQAMQGLLQQADVLAAVDHALGADRGRGTVGGAIGVQVCGRRQGGRRCWRGLDRSLRCAAPCRAQGRAIPQPAFRCAAAPPCRPTCRRHCLAAGGSRRSRVAWTPGHRQASLACRWCTRCGRSKPQGSRSRAVTCFGGSNTDRHDCKRAMPQHVALQRMKPWHPAPGRVGGGARGGAESQSVPPPCVGPQHLPAGFAGAARPIPAAAQLPPLVLALSLPWGANTHSRVPTTALQLHPAAGGPAHAPGSCVCGSRQRSGQQTPLSRVVRAAMQAPVIAGLHNGPSLRCRAHRGAQATHPPEESAARPRLPLRYHRPAGPQLASNAPRTPCSTFRCVGTAIPLIVARSYAHRITTHTR
jgi:hypothetical protein